MGVQIVQRWILAALRHRTFFSLGELNAAIVLERLNARAFRKLPGSRRSLFEQLDRPALRPLPTERYLDLRAVGASHDIAKLAGTPAAAVLCGIPARGSLAVEAQSALEAHALPVAPVRIGHRAAFVHAMTSAQGVQEQEPRGKAAREITRLYDWTHAQASQPDLLTGD